MSLNPLNNPLDNNILKLHIEDLDLGNVPLPLLIGENGSDDAIKTLICLTKDTSQKDFERIAGINGKVFLLSDRNIVAPTCILGTVEVWSSAVPDFRSIMRREYLGSSITFIAKKYN